MMSKMLSIGEVAQRVQLQPSAIRYYESEGLLPAPHRVKGRRRYDETIFQRLALIQFMRHAGFRIADLRTLLLDFPTDTLPSVRWQRVATGKLAEVEAVIQQMQLMKNWLSSALQCRCASIDDCAAAFPNAPSLTCGS